MNKNDARLNEGVEDAAQRDLVKQLVWAGALRGGRGGPWSPANFGGVKGSKGHTLLSSIQILPPTISKGGGECMY